MKTPIVVLVALFLVGCHRTDVDRSGGSTDKSEDMLSESICECLSPYNDSEIMEEWLKIQNRLQSRGISLGVASSIGAVFSTSSDRAQEARSIITNMIANNLVDAKKLHLKLRLPLCKCISPLTHEAVAKEWAKAEATLKAHGILMGSCQNEVTAVFCVGEDQIESARSIISAMVKNKELDAEKIGLRLIQN